MKKIFKNIIEFYLIMLLLIIVTLQKIVKTIVVPFVCISIVMVISTIIFKYPLMSDAATITDNVYITQTDVNDTDINMIDNINNDNNIINVTDAELALSINTIQSNVTNDTESSDYAFANNMYNPQTAISRWSIIPRNIDNNKSDIPDTNISWTDNIGSDIIEINSGSLIKCKLPEDYGDYIDIATFKPYEDYRAITNRKSAAYRVSHSDLAYTDKNGFRRYALNDNEFTISDSGDDYIVALGSAYTRNGTEGQRFLIVGDNGMYTVKIGDHKSDLHTDSKHMYSSHGSNSQYGGLIEFIVNSSNMERSTKNSGSINSSSVTQLTGGIKAIYMIKTDPPNVE